MTVHLVLFQAHMMKNIQYDVLLLCDVRLPHLNKDLYLLVSSLSFTALFKKSFKWATNRVLADMYVTQFRLHPL